MLAGMEWSEGSERNGMEASIDLCFHINLWRVVINFIDDFIFNPNLYYQDFPKKYRIPHLD